MKKRKTALWSIGAALLLVLIVCGGYFLFLPMRMNAIYDRVTADPFCLFISNRGAGSVEIHRTAPLNAQDLCEAETDITVSAGETASAALWLWSGADPVQVDRVQAAAFYSIGAGEGDLTGVSVKTIKSGTVVPARQAVSVPISIEVPADMTPGVYRLVFEAQAKVKEETVLRTEVMTLRVFDGVGVEFCAGGSSGWTVVEKASASAAERRAATLLIDSIYAASGAKLSVRKDTEPAQSREIVIGFGARTDGLDELRGENLGEEDAYVAISEDQILLLGGSDRSVLYAVQLFLEEFFGCRFYADNESYFAHPIRDLTLPVSTRLFSADYDHRAVYTGEGADWSVASAACLNGGNLQPEARYGSALSYAGGYQLTLEDLIPASVYYSSNRSFYSPESKSAGDAQLCLSNASVKEILCKQIAALLKKNAQVNRISLQYTYANAPCTCNACAAANEAEGSAAGAYVRLVNSIIRTLRSDESLSEIIGNDAFRFQIILSGAACIPVKTAPDSALEIFLSDEGLPVGVRYADPACTIGDTGVTFGQALEKWCQVNAHVGVLANLFDSSDYLLPAWDPATFAENVSYAHGVGADGLIVSGCGGNTGADAADIKIYIAGLLMRKTNYPAVLAIHDCLNDCFGRAAGCTGEYLAAVAERMRTSRPLCGGGYRKDVWDSAFLDKLSEQMDKAETAVRNDSERLYAVCKLRMGLRRTQLHLLKPSATSLRTAETFFDDVRRKGVSALSPTPLAEEKNAILSALTP